MKIHIQPKHDISRTGVMVVVGSCALLLAVFVTILGPRTSADDEPALEDVEGYALAQRGDFEGAYEWFAKAATEEPIDPKLLFKTGQMAELIGRSNEAGRYATSAWEMGFRTIESCSLVVRTTLTGVGGEEFLQRALALFDRLPPAEQSLAFKADLKLRGGLVDEAIEDWKEIARETASTEVLDKLAGVLTREGRQQEAWDFMNALWEDGVQIDEQGFALLAMLAATRSTEELDDLCRDVRDIDMDGAQFQMTNALLRLTLNQIPQARLLFESVAESDKIPDSDLAARARLFIGFLATADGDRNTIETLAAKAKQLPPSTMSEGESQWHELLLEMLDGTATDVETRLRQIAVATNQHPAVRLLLAQTLAKAGEHSEAREQFLAIRGLEGHWMPVQMGLAATSFRQRDDLEAIQIVAQLHQQGRRNDASENLLLSIIQTNGLGLAKSEESQQLKEAFDAISDGELPQARTLLKKNGHTAAGVRLLAQIEMMAGNENAALAQMNSKAPLEPRDWIMLGNTADRHQHWDSAARAYARALESEPDDVMLKNNWASARIQSAKLSISEIEQILSVSRKNLQTRPDDPVILQTLAACLVRAGRLDECAQLLEEHRSLLDDRPAVLLHLGQTYANHGAKAEALELLKRCRDSQLGRDRWLLPIARKELDQQIQSLEAA